MGWVGLDRVTQNGPMYNSEEELPASTAVGRIGVDTTARPSSDE